MRKEEFLKNKNKNDGTRGTSMTKRIMGERGGKRGREEVFGLLLTVCF